MTELLVAVLSIVGTMLGINLWLLKIVFTMQRKLAGMENAINASGEKRKAEIREFVMEMLNKSMERITDRMQSLEKTDQLLARAVTSLRGDVADIRKQGRFYTPVEDGGTAD